MSCEFFKLKTDITEEYVKSGRVGVRLQLLEDAVKDVCCGTFYVHEWVFKFAREIECKNVAFEIGEDSVPVYVWFIKDINFEVDEN